MNLNLWFQELSIVENEFDAYRLKERDVTEAFKAKAHRILKLLMTSNLRHYSRQLESEFGLSGAEIRKIIRWLRFEGHPIASTLTGYYYAHESRDLDSTVKHLIDRARADMMVALALRKTQEAQKSNMKQTDLFKVG